MKNSAIVLKSVETFLIISFIIWLGGYISRHLVIYQLFEPKDLTLRSLYYEMNLNAVLNTLLPLVVSNIISFISFLILFVIYLVLTPLKCKRNGWLFISFLIIIITCPFELYLLIKDYHIASAILNQSLKQLEIIELIKTRITTLSSFSLIEIFSYLSIVFLVIFKPLTPRNEA